MKKNPSLEADGHSVAQFSAFHGTLQIHYNVYESPPPAGPMLTFRYMMIPALWDMTSCSLLGSDRHFTGAYCLHHQGKRLHGAITQKAANFILQPSEPGISLGNLFLFTVSTSQSSTQPPRWKTTHSLSAVRYSLFNIQYNSELQ
jgi:hypothetical protein